MSSDHQNAIVKYFSEFKVLKEASSNFWITNLIQFFDGLAYFSMITIFTLFLNKYCGFDDASSTLWVGLYTLFISALVFAVGTICDIIGIKKSYTIGLVLLLIGRIFLGLGTNFATDIMHLKIEDSRPIVMVGIFIMSFGTAFMSPVIQTSIRRFTTIKVRPTGFNFYYLFMNIAAWLSGWAIVDGFRKAYGDVDGCYYVINFGTVMCIIVFILTRFLDDDYYAEPSERMQKKDQERRPLQLFAEVWKESAFRKLIIFLVLTLGVRIVFTLQFLIMPQYYSRTIYDDFALGFVNSLNPMIIVLGLILLIPIINRYSTVKLMIVGMSISAFSLVFMAVPIEWYYIIPGIETRSQAFLVAIITQIVIFAFGELLFSPRFSEYVARVAPKDKVASYMSIAALPMFIAKPINGVIGGLLISYLCYDGIAAKMDTGHIGFWQSPSFMWFIYLTLAVLSPIAIILTRKSIASDHPEEDAAKELEPMPPPPAEAEAIQQDA